VVVDRLDSTETIGIRHAKICVCLVPDTVQSWCGGGLDGRPPTGWTAVFGNSMKSLAKQDLFCGLKSVLAFIGKMHVMLYDLEGKRWYNQSTDALPPMLSADLC